MKLIKYFVILLIILNIITNQCNAESINDSIKTKNEDCNLSFKVLPFAFYDNSLGLVFGGLGGIKGFPQKETFTKIGGLVSSAGSFYGFLQVENLQLPFFPRIFMRPDFYVGKVKDVKLYLKPTLSATSPGNNDSKEGDYFDMSGYDRWYEFSIKYLLPIGHGKDSAIINPTFKNGLLVSGETGGTNWNPLKSGRSFLETKLYYRNIDLSNGIFPYKTKTFVTEYAISYENMDYYFNPTIGSYKRLSYLVDWGAASDNNKFNAVRLDCRWYYPLYDKNSDDLPCVLAFNFLTMDTPSWNDYDIVTNANGTVSKVYHRPQLFVSASLGGEKRLRAYSRFRYYDKSMIYYSAEIRKNLGWNPFNYWSLTRKIGVDFLQLVGFVDLGRVAPAWNIETLHSDMKYSVGGGVRLFIDGLIVRVDAAYGQEGVMTQMFIDHPF